MSVSTSKQPWRQSVPASQHELPAVETLRERRIRRHAPLSPAVAAVVAALAFPQVDSWQVRA